MRGGSYDDYANSNRRICIYYLCDWIYISSHFKRYEHEPRRLIFRGQSPVALALYHGKVVGDSPQ